MPKKLQGLLITFLLILAILPVNRLEAYEPIVTIGKPPLNDILYSPDGRFLATLTPFNMELLDAKTLAPVLHVPVYDGHGLSFSPDSSLLAISGPEEGIQIWHVDSERFLATIPVDTRLAEFSPDRKHLAYTDQDSVFLWDVKQMKTVLELPGAGRRVRAMAFHPNGNTLAVGYTNNKAIALWDIKTKEIFSHPELERRGYLSALSFSHDGVHLAAIMWSNGTPGHTLSLWNIPNGNSRHWDGHFADVVFGARDERLLVGGRNGNLHIIHLDTFSVESIPVVDNMPPPDAPGVASLRHLTNYPDGSRIASMINSSRIRVWDTQDFSRLQTLYGYGWAHSIADALYLPKVNRIVTGKYTDVLHFWDATTGELLKAVEFYMYIDALSVSPDGTKIAMSVEDTCQIWDAAAAEQLAVFDLNCSPGPGATAFSPSEEYFVYMGMCGSHFWNAKTGEKITWEVENAWEKRHMDGSWTNYSLAVFSSDGEQFVAIAENFGEHDKTMLWDFETGLPISETDRIGPVVDVGTDFLQAYQVGETMEIRLLKSGRLLSSISDNLPEWSHWDVFWRTQFHPSGNILAIQYDWSSTIREGFGFYNVWSGELISAASGMVDLKFAADGSYVFLVDDKGQLGLYRAIDVLGESVPTAFAVDPSGKQITTLGRIKQDQLLQNYPNPFNPETWIPYQLASDSNVTVRIYDVSGRVIRILDVGNRKSGLYIDREKAVHWDGRNQRGETVASGIYFYQLVTGDGFSATKKTLLVK